MATRDRFYDSEAGDRVYNAAAWAQWSQGIISEGYVPDVGDELAVTESSPAAMSVDVGTGIAWPDGRFFEVYDSAETLTIPTADGSNPRIDRIVVRNDLNARETVLAVLVGSPAADPDPPSLTRTSTVYEISLAQVEVAASASSISNSEITDEREDDDVCGRAMPRGTSPIATGSYVGNGSDSDRVISTGLANTQFVIVAGATTDDGVGWGIRETALGYGTELDNRNVRSASSNLSKPTVNATHFTVRDTVGSGNTLNQNGVTYQWFALGG